MRGTSHPRRNSILVAGLSAIVFCVVLAWHYWRVPVLVLGPMVQQVSTDSFAVFCQVHPAAPQIHADVSDDGRPTGTTTITPQKLGRYVITFTGLQPGRPYEYRITLGGRVLAQHRVQAAPADNRPFRFLAFGDSGTGDWAQNSLVDPMISYRPDLIVHTGDLIYPCGRLEENPCKFFQPYAALLATAPIYPCLGNHEYKLPGVEPVAESFILPPNGPAGQNLGRNYWFDYGNARFVSLDGNNPEAFFQNVAAPWMDEVLRTAGNRWRIVFFHQPVYTHGKYEPAEAIGRWIVPILERHNVELVLCGHNHMYERTHPVRNGKIVPDGSGTIHVTTGAGGANLAHVRLPMPETIAVWNDREHSFTVVDVTADVIHLRQINASGRQIDEYNICRRTPTTQAAR